MKESKNYFFQDIKHVIFDLDGVITNTAIIHQKAWKSIFDLFLKEYLGTSNSLFQENDYFTYIDGKPREQGIKDYLLKFNIKTNSSQQIIGKSKWSIKMISENKNNLFIEMLSKEKLFKFDDAYKLICQLKKIGVIISVASSSKNCKLILKKLSLLNYFDCILDGSDLSSLNLKGKPFPDIINQCCYYTKITPCNSLVIEDAIVGILASKSAGIKYTIGLDRKENFKLLLEAGADIVIKSLDQLKIKNE
jgi:alpha,alpha-trehalase